MDWYSQENDNLHMFSKLHAIKRKNRIHKNLPLRDQLVVGTFFLTVSRARPSGIR